VKQYRSYLDKGNDKEQLNRSNEVIYELNNRNVKAKGNGYSETENCCYSKDRKNPQDNSQCTSHSKFMRCQSLAKGINDNVLDMSRTELHSPLY